jgi:hypothetical protein
MSKYYQHHRFDKGILEQKYPVTFVSYKIKAHKNNNK